MAVPSSTPRTGDASTAAGKPAASQGPASTEQTGGGSRTARATNEYEGLAASAGPISVSDDQQLATLTHMMGVLGCVPSVLIHRWSRGRARFTEQESLEAANFTLLPSLVIVAGALLGLIPFIGWIFAIFAAGAWLVLAVSSVAAAVAANSGRPYRYRLNHYLYDTLTNRRAERRRQRQSTHPVTAQGHQVTPLGRTDAPETDAYATEV